MGPIDTLMNEHHLIENVLDVAESYARRLPQEPLEDRPKLRDLLTFFSEFADACHHDKEEKILFTAMVENGFPSGDGPLAVMLQEHDLGRDRLRILRGLSTLKQPWTPEDRLQVAGHLGAYAELLRAHILKEDLILYPMALTHLPEETFQEIEERFRRIEAREAVKYERLIRLAESLVRASPSYSTPSSPRA